MSIWMPPLPALGALGFVATVAGAVAERAMTASPRPALLRRAEPPLVIPPPELPRSESNTFTAVPVVAPAIPPPLVSASVELVEASQAKATLLVEPRPMPVFDDPATRPERLEWSINGLAKRDRDLSSQFTVTRGQRRGVLALLVVSVGALGVSPHWFFLVLITATDIIYVTSLWFRLHLLRLSLRRPNLVAVSDEEARMTPDAELPVYTVLVPAYREPEVVARLLSALDSLEYPKDKLDVKLLLEEDDDETRRAADEAGADARLEVVIVPAGEPRTKPKALNYGLTLARGDIVTIYDAEDRPDPLQLRRAAVALARMPERVVCVQARLGYFNPSQNLITRWFTIEYAMWFSQLLPGLVQVDAPVPLGGTSNHFRRPALVEVGAWDPFNVTEDADLGIRLHRAGYRTAIVESTTLEEANSDFVNWVKQRSRWYKGYLQTWLVHMRKPRRLLNQLGLGAFLRFNLFVGGTPLLALLNPVFWIMCIVWFIGRPGFVLHLFPSPVYYTSLGCWLGGNFIFTYMCVLTALELDQIDLVLAALLMPLYWVMMSVAGAKALLQLAFAPSYWEKTHHGLDTQDPASTTPVL
jgi:cellulose synthase/poly-beta-1,6-N-acetylglucosamine synthase-like glycosyltransferase